MIKAHHKHIYLKKIETRDGFDVWLVNGQYIRKEINENFVGYDYHYHHEFIPKNELWIDEETNADERHFFIDHMLFEIPLYKFGGTKRSIFIKGDEFENKIRSIENHKKYTEKLKHNRRILITTIHKEKLEPIVNKITMWLVDGRMVRDLLLADYTAGGHDMVYTFIPKNEIWIDDVLFKDERRFILLHELHERSLMAQGHIYSQAHKSATLVEDYYRDHPEELEARIQKELEQYT